MKFLFLIENYHGFYNSKFHECAELSLLPYKAQSEKLFETFFYHGDAYAHNLHLLGHQADQVVMNCEPLQRKWAQEYGLKLDWINRRPWRWWLSKVRKKNLKTVWMKKVLLAQIKEYRPDVLYVFSGVPVYASLLKKLKKHVPLVVCQWACPLSIPNYPFHCFDLILSSMPHLVEWFRSQGRRSEYFELAFDERVLQHVNTTASRSGVVFVGSIGRFQRQRLKLLEFLCRYIDIDIYLPSLRFVPEDSVIRNYYRGQAMGLEMYKVFAQAKIAIHAHMDLAEEYANAKRLYEATGVGAMLITDKKKNMDDLFKVGKEVVDYTDPNDCVKKIQYYLEHEQERAAIARAGQERTLREYTYKQRMVELLEILGRYLKGKLKGIKRKECLK